MHKKKIFLLSKESGGGIKTFTDEFEELSSDYSITSYFYKPMVYPYKGVVRKNIHSPTCGERYTLVNFIYHIAHTFFLISKKRPHIIISLNMYATVVAALVRLNKKDFIHTVLVNTDLKQEIIQKSFIEKLILPTLVGFALRRSDKVVFASRGLARAMSIFLKLPSEKTTVIYNAVDFNVINKTRHTKLKEYQTLFMKKKKGLCIMSAGRLSAQKDFETILRAFAQLKADLKRYGVFLVIVGEGKLKDSLKQLARDLKISSNVYFLGWKKSIYQYLKKADIFVFSSFYEGFGRVLLEAMAVGVPVVATDTPYGPREILHNGKYGILIPMRNSKRMAHALEKLVLSSRLRKQYQQLGVARARYFSMKSMTRKFDRLFSSLLRQQSS